MKKFLSIALIAIMGLSFTSCGDKNSNDAEAEASAKATNDPISVAMGEFMGKGMAMQQQAQPTPIDKKLFIEGLGAVLDADTTSNYSYLLGMQAAMNVMAQVNQLKATQNITLDLATLKKEISKAFNSEKVATQEEMLQMQNNIQALMNQQTAKNAEKDPKAVENKKAGEEFLKKKAAEPGYTKSKSGLVYKVLQEGNGANFTVNDAILTKYVGKHIDGKEFDSSKGQAVPFRCGAVIPGFAEMLQLMKPGMKVEVIIPSDLAYGPQGANGAIAPNETLVFELETVGKQEASAPQKAK